MPSIFMNLARLDDSKTMSLTCGEWRGRGGGVDENYSFYLNASPHTTMLHCCVLTCKPTTIHNYVIHHHYNIIINLLLLIEIHKDGYESLGNSSLLYTQNSSTNEEI